MLMDLLSYMSPYDFTLTYELFNNLLQRSIPSFTKTSVTFFFLYDVLDH